MRVLYRNPYRDVKLHFMWIPTDSRKGEDDHCWMKASRCLSTPLEPPLRPSYWLFRLATTSLHISSINITGCVVWLEKTRLHLCFHSVQTITGLTNSNITWDFTVIGVAWILSMGEKPLGLLSPKSSPPLDTRTCQLGLSMITNMIVPYTWHNCSRQPTPHHIWWVSW